MKADNSLTEYRKHSPSVATLHFCSSIRDPRVLREKFFSPLRMVRKLIGECAGGWVGESYQCIRKTRLPGSLLWGGHLSCRRTILARGPEARAPFKNFRFKERLVLAPGVSAFSLIELLIVVAIIAIVMALAAPAFNSIKGGGDLTKAAYDIAGILDNARAYAMANNTFVYVGIAEVDSSLDPSASPQTLINSPAIGGRVAVATVASRDGTRGYNVTSGSLPSPAWTNYNNGANLMAIGKLQRFENVHLAPLFSTLPNSGGLSRPTVSSGNYQLGNANCASVTPFAWPLGQAIGAGQYSFSKVINYDPQGIPRIQTTGNTDDIVKYMEIGLLPTRGKTVSTNVANAAAIQINGITGAVRVYRP